MLQLGRLVRGSETKLHSLYRLSTTRCSHEARAHEINGGSQTSLGSRASRVDFFDHKKGFQDKSFFELTRGMLVLGMCSFESFSLNSLKVRVAVKIVMCCHENHHALVHLPVLNFYVLRKNVLPGILFSGSTMPVSRPT